MLFGTKELVELIAPLFLPPLLHSAFNRFYKPEDGNLTKEADRVQRGAAWPCIGHATTQSSENEALTHASRETRRRGGGVAGGLVLLLFEFFGRRYMGGFAAAVGEWAALPHPAGCADLFH